MKVVLDTNVLLVSISPRSKSYWVFQNLLYREYDLCVTNEILYEYEEVITRHMGARVAYETMNALFSSSNLIFVNPYFEWSLIYTDPDDNKFVDCAIAANAKFIVSEDQHFRVLKQIPYPKVEVRTIEEFRLELGL